MTVRKQRNGGATSSKISGPAFGPRATSKIRDIHLDRLAVVYVRQSSPQQVIENRESRERQYALAQYAERLGWPAERVLTIDEDQGLSGKSMENRVGFQRLMAEVSLNHVGIVLGLEITRLSRSNKDWHQLIDVCGIFNTLLCDQDGVYDSTDGNDRLLLGMKGAMSEFELVTLHNRLIRGSRNKAERGELFLRLPSGYVKDPSGEVVKDPDEQVQAVTQLVFDKFAELGTAYGVFRYFTVNKLRLGFRRANGDRKGELEWRPATPTRILWFLRHPFYAGTYAYGLHRNGKKNPLTGEPEGGKWFVPPEELPVLIHDRLPAYISWDQYLANQETLKQNRAAKGTRGAPKRGAALLSGLVVCGKCGHHLGTRYPGDKKPSYQCLQYALKAEGLEEFCGHIAAATLDNLVVEQVLRALEPASLELSLQALALAEQDRDRLHEQWQQRLERARQNVSRTERQYQLAEPENRLVTRTLESRWEEALKQFRNEQEEYQRVLAKTPASLNDRDRRQIASLSENIHELWNSAETSVVDHKRIIRCLIDRIVLTVNCANELNNVTIIWQGGMETKHKVSRPVGCYENLTNYRQLVDRIRTLHSQGIHLAQIAETLNSEGFVPPRRRGVFTETGVAAVARRLGLHGELFRDELLKKHEWWIPDLAKTLRVIHEKVHYWAKQGWVHSRRTPSGKHLIVWADGDELSRLRQIVGKQTSWFAARHPELVVPKKRRAKK